MAYKVEQLRGALLEEAILYLLKSSGYTPILKPGSDSSLQSGSSGLEVKGRGSWHQIDALADYNITPPFSNPQRLLIEAKFYTGNVRLPIIRNATGVVKDVSENWTIEKVGASSIAKKRFHYLYAIFSSSDFTKPAQDYAYAQDIYLLPLRRSTFFSPVIAAIDKININADNSLPTIKNIRRFVRNALFNEPYDGNDVEMPDVLRDALQELINICREQSFGFIAMFGGQFPAFLVASPEFRPEEYDHSITVRIRWIDGTWFIEDDNNRQLFSFDLPEEVFSLYASSGALRRQTVANIKGDIMREFYAFYSRDGRLRLLRFELDERWFEEVQENLRR